MSGLRLRAGMVALLLPLAACVNMSGLGADSEYACAAPEGVACDSVSGTYANAVHHNLPSQRRPQAAPAQTAGPAPSPTGSADAPGNATAPPRPTPGALALTDTSSFAPQALRSQARYLRLWIKPWEDIDGDLFDQAHVYVQVDHGHWQIDHVRQHIREKYSPLRPPVSSAPALQGEPAGDSSAADATDAAKAIPRGSVMDPRQSFPSLVSPPTTRGARPH